MKCGVLTLDWSLLYHSIPVVTLKLKIVTINYTTRVEFYLDLINTPPAQVNPYRAGRTRYYYTQRKGKIENNKFSLQVLLYLFIYKQNYGNYLNLYCMDRKIGKNLLLITITSHLLKKINNLC